MYARIPRERERERHTQHDIMQHSLTMVKKLHTHAPSSPIVPAGYIISASGRIKQSREMMYIQKSVAHNKRKENDGVYKNMRTRLIKGLFVLIRPDNILSSLIVMTASLRERERARAASE
jgi:hypothetical protein